MVLADFFKTSPGGVTQNDVKNKEDVLEFFSIVLTYAKVAQRMNPNDSPKVVSKIMPRTDFTTMFQTQGISKIIPAAKLYDIVKALACFKNNAQGNGYGIDPKYCTGSSDKPTPNDQMDKQAFLLGSIDGSYGKLTVKDWIQSIANGAVPDHLTTLDKRVDSSIGGFGAALENVGNTNRAVPLFEFRGLPEGTTSVLVQYANEIEKNVVDLHKQFASAPKARKKRASNMLYRRSNTKSGNTCPPGCVLCTSNTA